MDNQKYTIGEVSRMTGVSIKTLQRWVDKKYHASAETASQKRARRNAEKNQELIDIEVNDRGYRFFTYQDIEKILVINLYRNFGMNYDDIRQILNSGCGLKENLINHRQRIIQQIDYNERILKEIKIIIKEQSENLLFEQIQKLSRQLAPDLPDDAASSSEENEKEIKIISGFVYNSGGALKSCLDFLNIDISTAWLYGATAFVINISEDVAPDCMEKWYDGTSGRLDKLRRNLGIYENKITANINSPDFAAKQLKAYEEVKNAVDNNIPAYAWELDKSEYYIITGYDDTGYYFAGPDCSGCAVPKPWQDLAVSKWGWLEVHIVSSGVKCSDLVHIKEVLELTIDHSKNLPYWIHNGYRSGSEAYNLWINAMLNKTATVNGVATNAAFWLNKREIGLAFLKEANDKTGHRFNEQFVKAIICCKMIIEEYTKLTNLFPVECQENIRMSQPAVNDAVQILRQLKDYEFGLLLIFKELHHLITRDIFPVSSVELSEADFDSGNSIEIRKLLEEDVKMLDTKSLITLINNADLEELLKSVNERSTHIITVWLNDQPAGIAVGSIICDSKNQRQGVIKELFLAQKINIPPVYKAIESSMTFFFRLNDISQIFLEIPVDDNQIKTIWNSLGYSFYKETMIKNVF